MKKIFLISILLIFATLSFCEDVKKVSLQLKWKYQFQFAGFIMAKEKGFYKDIGLDVELKEFDKTVDIIKNINSENIDFAVSDSALILEVLKGESMVAMMSILQSSPYSLMALKSSGIKEIEDMNGKRIALYNDFNGVAIDALLLSHNINYVKTPVKYSLNHLLSGKDDMTTVYLSNEPFVAKEKGLDVVLFNPKDYGFDGYGDILFTSKKTLKNRPELVRKMYKASKKGWEYAFSHIDESADVIFKKYNTLHKSKKALIYEGNTLKSLSGYGKNFGELKREKILGIAQIFSFMVKGKYNIENLDDFIYKQAEEKTSFFTREELEYIKEKKSVKVCAHPNEYPFVIFDKDGYSGMSIEFLKEFSKKSNLKFEIVPAKNLKEHLMILKDGKCDVIPIVVTKVNIFKFLTPTTSFVSDNIVLATRINEPYTDDLNILTDKKIAIQKGAKNLIKYVKSIYPNMNLVEVEDVGIDKVANGEFYGQIGVSYQLSYQIATEYFNELKIMSKIGDKKIAGSFGVTNREPLLLSIFNKLLDDISQLEHQKIMNAWLRVEVEKKFDYTHFIQFMSVSFIVILILLVSYIKQKNLHKKIQNLNDTLEKRVKEEVEKNAKHQIMMFQQSRLAQMGEMLSMIAHQWRQPLTAISATTNNLSFKIYGDKIDKEFFKQEINLISNYSQYLSQTIDDFRGFFRDDKEQEETTLENIINEILPIINASLKSNNIKVVENFNCHKRIKIYSSELKHVILNLIENAQDALLEIKHEEPIITIETRCDKDSVILSVRDNAGGINENDLDKIFDPYFSTKKAKDGTGLGLYMSKTIIEDHCDGELNVSNNKEGAVFSIVVSHL